MKKNQGPYTLSIDIGGTGIKMMVLDKKAKPLTEKIKVRTPRPATPKAVLKVLTDMIRKQISFDRVSVGFPGVVRNGVVQTAPNLDGNWKNVDLQRELHSLTKKPTKVANDADVQGYGDIQGKGLEMVITLGTGMGAALFIDGRLVPNLELGHHPFKDDLSYEDYLGKKALEKHGRKKWNKHLHKAILLMDRIFNYDRLYIGGGNSEFVDLKLPSNVVVAKNIAGLLGGVRLWETDAHLSVAGLPREMVNDTGLDVHAVHRRHRLLKAAVRSGEHAGVRSQKNVLPARRPRRRLTHQVVA